MTGQCLLCKTIKGVKYKTPKSTNDKLSFGELRHDIIYQPTKGNVAANDLIMSVVRQ